MPHNKRMQLPRPSVAPLVAGCRLAAYRLEGSSGWRRWAAQLMRHPLGRQWNLEATTKTL
jgi:hypothetical protein